MYSSGAASNQARTEKRAAEQAAAPEGPPLKKGAGQGGWWKPRGWYNSGGWKTWGEEAWSSGGAWDAKGSNWQPKPETAEVGVQTEKPQMRDGDRLLAGEWLLRTSTRSGAKYLVSPCCGEAVFTSQVQEGLRQ